MKWEGLLISAIPVVGTWYMCRGITEAEEAVVSSASRYFNSAMHTVKMTIMWYANPTHQQVLNLYM